MLLTLHRGTEEGKRRAEENGVSLYPTFSVINANEEELTSWIGFGSSEVWLGTVNDVLADPVSVPARVARFTAKPNANDAIRLGEYNRAKGQWREATDYYTKAMELNETLARENDIPIKQLRTIYNGAGAGTHTNDEAGAITLSLVNDPKSKMSNIYEVGGRLFRAADAIGIGTVTPMLSVIYDKSQNDSDPENESDKNGFLVNYELKVNGDTKKALQYKRSSMPAGWETDFDQLNSFAWFCFEAKANLEEAEELAAKGVQLAEAPNVKANILDTQAEIAFLRGSKDRAVKLISTAIELDPKSEYLKGQLTRFTKE